MKYKGLLNRWNLAICQNRNRGSYLVEAALMMPFFILAVVMLISAVPVLSTAENAVFSVADELRLEAVKSAIRQNGAILPVTVKHRLYSENERLEHGQITQFRYLYQKNGIEDLLTMQLKLLCAGTDPFGIFDDVTFSGTITARAFTGTRHRYAPAGGDEEQLVCIFPEWGMRYHQENCTHVKRSCQMVYLTEQTKKDCKPCKLCDARSAQLGSPVFCFMRYGEAYHLAGCSSIERYYIRIQLTKAKTMGYTPCTKCGG